MIALTSHCNEIRSVCARDFVTQYCARKRSSSGPFDTCEVSREGRLRSNQASRLNAWRTKSSESKGGHTCGDTYEKQSKTIKFKTSMVHWMDMESIGGRDRAF